MRLLDSGSGILHPHLQATISMMLFTDGMRTPLRVLVACLLFAAATAAPAKRSSWKRFATTPDGGMAFKLGEATYFANLEHPKALVTLKCTTTTKDGDIIPFTTIAVKDSTVTGPLLEGIVAKYLAGDDVFTADFLEGIYIAYNGTGTATIDASAVTYLDSVAPRQLFLDQAFSASAAKATFNSPVTVLPSANVTSLPAGPYAVTISAKSITFNTVYLLYGDEYQDFIYGTYPADDGAGNFMPLDLFYAQRWYPYIPVPSRIYSWSDPRPFAGARFAIKDLYDMKGLATSGGSRSWATIATPANTTAPSIQRILDLGGVLVGKFKLAEFALGSNPWEWQDAQAPFNPRGDGWLSCSASSSGGGCSIAAYPWLDYAIGTDTGSSMRRPAAVSGTYGNRPSQGLMTLEDVMPLGAATDTAGVFARNPHDWVRFAKQWYTSDLHQPESITGLSRLDAPDNKLWPKRVQYLTDYLPMANPAAEEVLQNFLGKLTSIFNMTLVQTSLSAVINASIATGSQPTVAQLNQLFTDINQLTQYRVVGKPLTEAWAARYDGRFPPVDAIKRVWHNANQTRFSQPTYDAAMALKRRAVDWFEKELLYSTPESCSESIMIWDVGTGGLPSFREQALITNNPAASALALQPARAVLNGQVICPIYGCVDITIPIGQVTYNSNVTFHTEYMPVTVSVIAKRGCDFMLFNMFDKLADEGVLKEVKTGRTAF